MNPCARDRSSLGPFLLATQETTVLRKAVLLLALPLLFAACTQPTGESVDTLVTDQAGLQQSEGLARKVIPEEDPGPPLYARVTTTLNQFFHTGDWLAIPFYRDPACVPAEFNLLQLFHFPGPEGPGAFACPLHMSGSVLIEPNAPLGTFPRHVTLTGDAVPFWFVRWSAFQGAAQDGVVNMAELQALNPLKGVATHYHETLKPREGEHLVVITARGTLEDGRTFQFHVTHVEAQTKSIQLRFR